MSRAGTWPVFAEPDAVERPETGDTTVPATAVQRGLHYVQRSSPDTAAYHLVFAARVHQPLEHRRLEEAFCRLVARHPSLRTGFVETPTGEIEARVATETPAQVGVIRTDSLSPEALRERILTETHRPFPLDRPPLLRVQLFTDGDAKPILVLTAHHIAVDFWSLSVVLDELIQFYRDDSTLWQTAPVTVEHWVEVLQRREAAERDTRARDYWLDELGGELPTVELPVDRIRPPVQRYRGASHAFAIPAETTAALKALARTEGVTPFMALLTLFQILVHRYSGQDDVLVASPAAGRTRRDERALIGNFVNTLVFRAQFEEGVSLRSLLQQTRERVIGALRHQNYPFPRLIEQLRATRDPSRSPVTQIAFAWERLPQYGELDEFFTLRDSDSVINLQGLQLSPYPLPQQEGQWELALEMGAEVDGALWGTLKYNTDLFDTSTAEAFARHYDMLIRAAVADPETDVRSLALLPPDERQRILVAWNATERPLDAQRPLHGEFERIARETPERVALRFEDRTLDYGGLERRANRLAHYLRELGVQPEDRVAICLSRGPDMVTALLAVLKIGAGYIPVDPAFPAERIALMLEDAEPRAVITESALEAGLPETPAQLLHLDLDHAAIERCSSQRPEVTVGGERPAYTIYTSGSTGRPKGVQVPHRAVVNFLDAMAETPGIGAEDTLLAVTTLSFDIAVLELFLPLSVGATCVLLPQQAATDPGRLTAAMHNHNVTVMQATPATWQMLLTAGWEGKPDLHVLCGGEALPRTLADTLLSRCASLWNLYGPTETTVWSAVERVTDGEERPAIGRPIVNTRIYVLDDARQPVPAGVVGELYIGGKGLALGYFRRPELTAAAFVHDPFSDDPEALMYRTGDLARLRRNGKLEYVGRTGSQVKIRGFRVELGDVEATLRRHPQVDLAAVIAAPDTVGGQRLAAFVIAGGEATLSVESLRDSLATRLPAYMIPAFITLLESMPLTPNGKIDRRRLPRPEPAVAPGRDYVPPRDSVEIELASIWEEVLGVPQVGLADDFFALGGHSLLAVRALALVRQRLQITLPANALIEHGTLEAFAHSLRRQDSSVVESAAITLRNGETGASPLFLMHPIGGTVFCYLALTRHLRSGYPIYGLQAQGIGLDDAAEVSVEAMAARYIEIMRERQPTGPYHIAGWCFGGVIGYEVASQLRAMGESVATLAMFDTRAPIPENHPDDGDDAMIMSWFARDLAVPYGKSLDIPPAELRELSADDMFRHVLEQAKAIGVLQQDADEDQLRRYFEVYVANAIALQLYEPGGYDGDITLYLAADEPEGYGPDLGWGHLSPQRLELRSINGTHNSVMYEPNVRQLAEAMNERLPAATY